MRTFNEKKELLKGKIFQKTSLMASFLTHTHTQGEKIGALRLIVLNSEN